MDDAHKLQQAGSILACIVTKDTAHPDFDLSSTLDVAASLVRAVLEHRRDVKRKRPPGRPPASATEQLLQAAAILRVCLMATEHDLFEESDVTLPLQAALALIVEAKERIWLEDDKTFVARHPKLMRECREAARAGAAMESPVGKPN
jgi:hypothetical protein